MIVSKLKFAATVLAALAVGFAYWKGRHDGATIAEARTATATIDQLRERGLINESVRELPACDLLRELDPDSVCDGLGD